MLELVVIKIFHLEYYDDIDKNFAVQHNLILLKLENDFSLIHSGSLVGGGPASANASTSTLTRLGFGRKSNSKQIVLPIAKAPVASSSTLGHNQPSLNVDNASEKVSFAILFELCIDLFFICQDSTN